MAGARVPFPLFVLLKLDVFETHFLTFDDKVFLPVFTSREYAEDYVFRLGNPLQVMQILTVSDLKHFVTRPPGIRPMTGRQRLLVAIDVIETSGTAEIVAFEATDFIGGCTVS